MKHLLLQEFIIDCNTSKRCTRHLRSKSDVFGCTQNYRSVHCTFCHAS